MLILLAAALSTHRQRIKANNSDTQLNNQPVSGEYTSQTKQAAK